MPSVYEFNRDLLTPPRRRAIGKTVYTKLELLNFVTFTAVGTDPPTAAPTGTNPRGDSGSGFSSKTSYGYAYGFLFVLTSCEMTCDKWVGVCLQSSKVYLAAVSAATS